MATILQTDAPLLFTPGLLGVAALRSGFRGVGISCPKLLAHYAKKGMYMGKEAASVAAAGGGGGVENEGGAEQQLLQQLRQVDELVMAQTAGLEGLQAKATEVDRKIKLWKRSLGGAGGAASGGGRGGSEPPAAGGAAAAEEPTGGS